MAKIELSMEEFKQLENERDEARRENVELIRRLTEAKLDSGEGAVRSLTELGRALLTVVRFAVGQIPPESVKHVPTKELHKASELLAVLADHSVDDVSIASELKVYAMECERLERFRAERDRPLVDQAGNPIDIA